MSDWIAHTGSLPIPEGMIDVKYHSGTVVLNIPSNQVSPVMVAAFRPNVGGNEHADDTPVTLNAARKAMLTLLRDDPTNPDLVIIDDYLQQQVAVTILNNENVLMSVQLANAQREIMRLRALVPRKHQYVVRCG